MRIRHAGFPALKSLNDFDWTAQPSAESRSCCTWRSSPGSKSAATSVSSVRPVLVHTALLESLGCKQSSLLRRNLDPKPFPSPLRDLDRSPLAALDLVQHGLAGEAEQLGGLGERQVARGHVGHEAPAHLVREPDPPGC